MKDLMFFTRTLAATCEYGELKDSLICDRIVCGIISDSVRARMLRDKDLNLTKAVDIYSAAEVSGLHLKALSTSDPDKSISAVRRDRGRNILQKKSTRYQEYVSQRLGNLDTAMDRSGPRYSKQSVVTNDNWRIPKHKQGGYLILDYCYCGYEH